MNIFALKFANLTPFLLLQIRHFIHQDANGIQLVPLKDNIYNNNKHVCLANYEEQPKYIKPVDYHKRFIHYRVPNKLLMAEVVGQLDVMQFMVCNYVL